MQENHIRPKSPISKTTNSSQLAPKQPSDFAQIGDKASTFKDSPQKGVDIKNSFVKQGLSSSGLKREKVLGTTSLPKGGEKILPNGKLHLGSPIGELDPANQTDKEKQANRLSQLMKQSKEEGQRANYGEAAESVDFLGGSPSIKDQEEFYTQVEREEASQGAVAKNDKSLNRREKKSQRKLQTNQKQISSQLETPTQYQAKLNQTSERDDLTIKSGQATPVQPSKKETSQKIPGSGKVTASQKKAAAKAQDKVEKELFPNDQELQEPIQEELKAMKPIIKENFEQIDGACEYFHVLEKDNQKLSQQFLQRDASSSQDAGVAISTNDPKKTLIRANQALLPSNQQQKGETALHGMPRGYPQKHMYKQPKISARYFQASVDKTTYRGSSKLYSENELMVYRDQKITLNDQNADSKIDSNQAHLKRRALKLTRSNSLEIQTLKFKHDRASHLADLENADFICGDLQGLNSNIGKRFRNMNQSQLTRKIQRKDELQAPLALNVQPKQLFVSEYNDRVYKTADLDDYLEFCDFYIREAPILGGYCGIWLRGSQMYREKALALLNSYNYNFDVAKFHILYPRVMSDPEKRYQILQIAQNHPKDLAREVAKARVDLQGCKQDEREQVLGKFRQDLENRINDEQLRYHLTILQKIKIATPSDIEEKIRQSIEFSKEIKRKCNITVGQGKSSINVTQEKKLKMSDLISLHEQQLGFKYITQEMMMLEQQLEKAKQWQQRVEEIRDKEVHIRQIEAIFQDGKNIPVNFQESMTEIKKRKQQAEDLNQRIQDAIIVKKTRLRANDTDKKPKDEDKEQQLRQLHEEARGLKVTSEKIHTLSQKINDIDKWKREVYDLLQKKEEEQNNYKRFKEHYRLQVTRSGFLQIELSLIKDLRMRCSLIDWRDKVEDHIKRIDQGEKMTLEIIFGILEDGKEKGFISKMGTNFKRIERVDPETKDAFIGENCVGSLFHNFSALDEMLQIYMDAQSYEYDLQKILNKICIKSKSESSDEKSDSVSESEERCGSQSQIMKKLLSNPAQKLHIRELEELEQRGFKLKLEIEKLKELRVRIDEIRQIEKKCRQTIVENTENGDFVIKSKDLLKEYLAVRETFENINIISEDFNEFDNCLSPYIFWINQSVKMIKQFYKSLGVKMTQLKLFDQIEVNPDSNLQNAFQKETDYKTIVQLNQELKKQKFMFLSESDEGIYVQQIIQKVDNIIQDFEQQKLKKSEDSFDLQKYFKLLENIQSSGLPIEEEVVERARVELKREKWIKKFMDLQQAGGQTQSLQLTAMDSQSTNQQPAQQYVKLKSLDILVKEYQSSKELLEDPKCQKLAQKLTNQQQNCQRWLDKFQMLFNSKGQLEPKGGTAQIDQLLSEGARDLDLKLKEFVDLQVHQRETSEWKKTTIQIFNNSKTVTFDQLKKHIKDTYEITEGSNRSLIELLTSLKESVANWKTFAKTILKIRPIANMQEILHFNELQIQDPEQELFCICRQPENGSLMLCCDFCDMWYHHTCIGLPGDLKLEKIKYKCIGCAIREGKQGTVKGMDEQSQHVPAWISQKDIVEGQQHDDFVNKQVGQQDQNQQQIEDLMLDYFQQKPRVTQRQFEYVLNEAENSLPIYLEEMQELGYIDNMVKNWLRKTQLILQGGLKAQSLLQNFRKINLNPKHGISDEIVQIQKLEKQFDDKLMDLLVEQESFPVILQPELNRLIQLIRARDWLRQAFLLIHQDATGHNSRHSNANAQPAKQGKNRFKREVKRMVWRGLQVTQIISDEQSSNLREALEQVMSAIMQMIGKQGKPDHVIDLNTPILSQFYFKDLSQEQTQPVKLNPEQSMQVIEDNHQIDTNQKNNFDQNLLNKERFHGLLNQEQSLKEMPRQNNDNNLDMSQFNMQIHQKEKTEQMGKSQERGQV